MQAVTWRMGTSLLSGQGRLLWWHYSEGRVFQCRLSHGEWEQVYCQGKVGCCGGTIVRAGCASQARRHVYKSGPGEVRASAKGTSQFGTSGGEYERGYPPLVRGVGGIYPEKCLVASMCVFNAFWMRFGRNFSRLRLIWNRPHLHESIMEH